MELAAQVGDADPGLVYPTMRRLVIPLMMAEIVGSSNWL
jgi:hypothetical protein